MKKSAAPLVISILIISSFAKQAEARFEYALKYRINQCSSCHVSPTGGGVRNETGKSFSAKNYKQNPWQTQEIISAEVRMLYYNTEKSEATRDGSGVMAGTLSLNLPLVEQSATTWDTRLVFAQNIAGFPGGHGSPRDTYVRWESYDNAINSWRPQHILLGRFVIPYGILLDEHRTYTRIQTSTTWNNLDMGVLLAANPTPQLHYDLTLINGERTAGANLSAGNATKWGSNFNLRWMPIAPAIVLGLSAGYHSRDDKDFKDPYEGSVYGGLSLGQLTGSLLEGTLTLEYSVARHWNGSIANFITDPAYSNAVRETRSRAYLAQLTWDLSEYTTLIYKFDQIFLDHNYPSDYYLRHGVGLRHYIGPNMFFQVRGEKAEATHPTESDGTGVGALDAAWALFQVSI